MVAPREDPKWIDPSRWGHLAPTRCEGWPHPDTYGVHQFLDAIPSGLNFSALGALGTPLLAIFSGVDAPFPKGEASYNQWAFEI